MIEIERQLQEAPDVCIICQYHEQERRVHIARFENESGEVIAYPGQDEFRRIMDENREEVAAAVSDCYEEAKKKDMGLLREGDVIYLPTGVNVLLVDFSTWKDVVIGQTQEGGVVLVTPGEFVVTTARTAEGNDRLAANAYTGYEVYAKKLNPGGGFSEEGALIHFFESGDLKPKLTGLIPIRKMKRVYIPAEE